MGLLAVIAAITLDRRARRPRRLPRTVVAAPAAAGARRLPARHAAAHPVGLAAEPQADAGHRQGPGARPLDARADDAGRDGTGVLLHHLRQLSEPQVLPPVHHGRGEVRPRAPPHGPRALPRPRARHRAAHDLRHRPQRARAVVGLPLVPAAGPTRARRLARVVAQHHLRLLVRHLPMPRLDARNCFLLRAADTRPRLPVLLPLQGPAGHRLRSADGLPVLRPQGRDPSTASREPSSPSPASRACTSRSPCWSR